MAKAKVLGRGESKVGALSHSPTLPLSCYLSALRSPLRSGTEVHLSGQMVDWQRPRCLLSIGSLPWGYMLCVFASGYQVLVLGTVPPPYEYSPQVGLLPRQLTP